MLIYWYRPHLKSASCDSTDNCGKKPDGWEAGRGPCLLLHQWLMRRSPPPDRQRLGLCRHLFQVGRAGDGDVWLERRQHDNGPGRRDHARVPHGRWQAGIYAELGGRARAERRWQHQRVCGLLGEWMGPHVSVSWCQCSPWHRDPQNGIYNYNIFSGMLR